MSSAPQKDGLEDILLALRHEDVNVREQAMHRLQKYSYSVTNEAAYDTLTKSQALAALDRDRTQRLQDRRIVEALLLTMEDSSARLRGLTALLLGNVALSEAHEALIRHLRYDPESRVRMTCAMGLEYTPITPQKTAGYISALQDSQYQVVGRACHVLGKTGDPQAIEPLRAVLTHSSWHVRFRACEALVRLKAVDSVVVNLLEMLNQMPEAQEYNEIVMKANEKAQEYNPASLESNAGKTGGQAQTTQVMLEQARRLLSG